MYIGRTGRTLKKRLKEHDYSVRRGDQKNGRAVHAWEKEHRVNWAAAKVRIVGTNLRKRKVLEAITIKGEKQNNNLDCGLQLSTVWNTLLEQLATRQASTRSPPQTQTNLHPPFTIPLSHVSNFYLQFLSLIIRTRVTHAYTCISYTYNSLCCSV